MFKTTLFFAVFFSVLSTQADVTKAPDREVAIYYNDFLNNADLEFMYVAVLAAYTDKVPTLIKLEFGAMCYRLGTFTTRFSSISGKWGHEIFKVDITNKDNLELHHEVFSKAQKLRDELSRISTYCYPHQTLLLSQGAPIAYQDDAEFYAAFEKWTDSMIEFQNWLFYDVQGIERQERDGIEQTKAQWLKRVQ